MKKNSIISVARKEIKFSINERDRVKLIDDLSYILYPDDYGDNGRYIVRTVYFDTLTNSDYTSKIKKDNYKKKIRIRTYASNFDYVKLEFKEKTFDNQLKQSLKITRKDAEDILNMKYEILLKYDNPLAKKCYNTLSGFAYRPVCLIQYDRVAFTHPSFSTRITMDNNILYSNMDLDIFNNFKNIKRMSYENNTVLEVKFHNFLFPQLQYVIKKCSDMGKPQSKFGGSREILNNYYL